MHDHLQLPVQVVGHNGRQDIHAAADYVTGRHIVHLGLAFEFGKQAFLGTTAMIEAGDLARQEGLVADHHLVLITTVMDWNRSS